MNISKNFEYYFCDFFGTLMFRDCSPDDIKRIWSNSIVTKLDIKIDVEEMYHLRRSCEIKAYSESNNGEFNYETLIKNVFERLSVFYNLRKDFKTFFDFCLKIETETEIEHQILNKELFETLFELKKLGKKMIIVSDFYLNSAVLKTFLMAKGVNEFFDGICVSCEYENSKAVGGLYDLVIDELCINDKKSVIMIGDNYKSDCVKSKKAGIRHFYYKSNKNYGKKIKAVDLLKTELDKKLDLSIYADYSYFFYLFIQRLYNNLSSEGFSNVYFFSREGEYLKKLFDCYNQIQCTLNNKPFIESHYLYVSRQSTYAPSLNADITKESFDKLFSEYPDLSINAFLKNIGIVETGEVSDVLKHLNINPKIIQQDIKNSSDFNKIINYSQFKNIYYDAITKKKENCVRYFKQEGITSNSRIAIVDVGWKGSIQDNIHKLLEDVRINGYYCGLSKNARFSKDNKKYGLMFSEIPFKSKDYSVWSFQSNFLERLLTASHPSTNYYEFKDNKYIPVFNDFGTEEENYRLIVNIQNSIYNKFNAISRSVNQSPFFENEIYSFFKCMHINNCCNVSKKHMILQQKLLAGQLENFGYQESAGKRINELVSPINVLLKLKSNIKLLMDNVLIANLLNIKGFHRTAAVFLRIAKKKLKGKSGIG